MARIAYVLSIVFATCTRTASNATPSSTDATANVSADGTDEGLTTTSNGDSTTDQFKPPDGAMDRGSQAMDSRPRAADESGTQGVGVLSAEGAVPDCEDAGPPNCNRVCGPNRVCANHRCYQGCYGSADCEAGTSCNSAIVCMTPPCCTDPPDCATVCYGYCQ
jgi:hypothetical protein